MAENPAATATPSTTNTSAPNAAINAFNAQREKLRANFMRLNNTQKITLLAALAAALAVIVWLVLYSQSSTYKVLFSNLDERDAGNITEYLTAQNIPYKVEAYGAILVEEKNVHATRLRLATQGLPRGGHVGFELMENQKFGISQFAEQVNYQRALEGELSKTIEAIASLEKARVHLAIPKPSVFIRENQKPSASVMVKLYPGRILDSTQIAGITHLVASSVPNLPNENVTIVNQDGSILQEKTSKTIESGLDPVQLSYVKEIESGIIKRIEAILEPVFGRANFKVQASADVDFSKNEQTAEIYRPNAKPEESAVRSQQTSESAGVNVTLGGVPGALTNQPPVPAIAPLTQPSTTPPQPSRSNNKQEPGRLVSAGIDAPLETLGQPIGANKTNTINYELDKTIRHTKGAIGEIRRLTAAVVVNFKKVVAEDGTASLVSLTDEELGKVESLVKDAMGFNQNRGDSVAVVSSQFNDMQTSVVGNFISAALENPAPLEAGASILKYLVVALILAFLYFKIMRPALRTMFPTAEDERVRAEAKVKLAEAEKHPIVTEEVEEVEYDDEGNVVSRTTTTRRARQKPEEIDEEAPPEETTEERRARLARRVASVPYADKLNKARDMAISDPKAVASVVKEWMGANGT